MINRSIAWWRPASSRQAASAGDANLTFVRTSVANVPADEGRAMLALYEEVFQGKAIVHDESSPEQNHLELFGLVRVEQNRLLVRNGIYRRIFNEKWIRDQLAGRSRSFVMPLVIIAVVAALGIVGLAAQQAGYFEPTPTQVVVNDTATPSVSIDTPTIATPTLGTQPIPTPQPVSPEPTIATPSDTPVPPNTPVRPAIEAERLRVLRSFDILDTDPEQAFDDVMLLAARICDAPIGIVSLAVGDRQWFKTRDDVDIAAIGRASAFCKHAMGRPGVTQVFDAAQDPLFADHPLVTGP